MYKLLTTALLLSATGLANAALVTDDFNVAHDYSGGNVAGTIWDGIRFNEGDISGVVANANTTRAGELHFESAAGNWSGLVTTACCSTRTSPATSWRMFRLPRRPMGITMASA